MKQLTSLMLNSARLIACLSAFSFISLQARPINVVPLQQKIADLEESIAEKKSVIELNEALIPELRTKFLAAEKAQKKLLRKKQGMGYYVSMILGIESLNEYNREMLPQEKDFRQSLGIIEQAARDLRSFESQVAKAKGEFNELNEKVKGFENHKEPLISQVFFSFINNNQMEVNENILEQLSEWAKQFDWNQNLRTFISSEKNRERILENIQLFMKMNYGKDDRANYESYNIKAAYSYYNYNQTPKQKPLIKILEKATELGEVGPHSLLNKMLARIENNNSHSNINKNHLLYFINNAALFFKIPQSQGHFIAELHRWLDLDVSPETHEFFSKFLDINNVPTPSISDLKIAEILIKNNALNWKSWKQAAFKSRNLSYDSFPILEAIFAPDISLPEREQELSILPYLKDLQHLRRVRKFSAVRLEPLHPNLISKIGALDQNNFSEIEYILDQNPFNYALSMEFLLEFWPLAKSDFQKELIKSEVAHSANESQRFQDRPRTPEVRQLGDQSPPSIAPLENYIPFSPFVFDHIKDRTVWNKYQNVSQKLALFDPPINTFLEEMLKKDSSFDLDGFEKILNHLQAKFEREGNQQSPEKQKKLQQDQMEDMLDSITLLQELFPQENPIQQLEKYLSAQDSSGMVQLMVEEIVNNAQGKLNNPANPILAQDLRQEDEKKQKVNSPICRESASDSEFSLGSRKSKKKSTFSSILNFFNPKKNSFELRPYTGSDSHIKQHTKYLGIDNPTSTTCFFNSVLKLFITDQHLVKLFDPKANPLKKGANETPMLFEARKKFQALSFLIAKSAAQELPGTTPNDFMPSFYRLFNRVQLLRTGHTGLERDPKLTIPGNQHDAQEAVTVLFDIFDLDHSPMAFHTIEVFKPHNKQSKVTRVAENMLSLPAVKHVPTIGLVGVASTQEAYNIMSKSERIEYKDERTKREIGAIKISSVLGAEVPETFIVALKRTNYDPIKDSKFKMDEGVASQSLKIPYFSEEGEKLGHHYFELTGLVLHRGGSANDGHYRYLDLQNPKKPVMHNDDKMTEGSGVIEPEERDVQGVIYRYHKVKSEKL